MPSRGENRAWPPEKLPLLCKDGNKEAVEQMLKASNASGPSDLLKRTCLCAAVIGGNSDLLECLLTKWCPLPENIANQEDGYDNPAMHLAVRRNRLDLVKLLLDFESNLCYSRNKDGETPLFVAVRLGIGEMVEALVYAEPKSVLKLCGNRNVLHLAVELHLVHIVRLLANFLNKHEDSLKPVINHGFGKPLSDPDITSGVSTNQSNSVAGENGSSQDPILGDASLHIAARRKCLQMVDFLLGVRGVDKYAMNDQDLTALDIAKEGVEYYERYKIIAKLSDYPSGLRPFMYNAPSPSLKKLENANKIIEDNFKNRLNAEIVVAALLATMTFSAVFQVPGGFQTENKDGIMIGAPILIHYTSFKLFLISDCVAFFLSLFVVFMWQMSSELTTGDKMLFMCVNNLLVCLSFAFTACGFMAAVYVVLAHKVRVFSWGVLGSMAFIFLIGCIACWHKAATFSVTRARFNRLCGVPCVLDDVVELVWLILERCHLLDLLRKWHEWVEKNFILGLCSDGCLERVKKHLAPGPHGNGRRERETALTGKDGLGSPCPLLQGSQYSV